MYNFTSDLIFGEPANLFGYNPLNTMGQNINRFLSLYGYSTHLIHVGRIKYEALGYRWEVLFFLEVVWAQSRFPNFESYLTKNRPEIQMGTV